MGAVGTGGRLRDRTTTNVRPGAVRTVGAVTPCSNVLVITAGEGIVTVDGQKSRHGIEFEEAPSPLRRRDRNAASISYLGSDRKKKPYSGC